MFGDFWIFLVFFVHHSSESAALWWAEQSCHSPRSERVDPTAALCNDFCYLLVFNKHFGQAGGVQLWETNLLDLRYYDSCGNIG